MCRSRNCRYPFAATGAVGVPGRTGQPDPRRYAGSALREERAGHQYQARPQPQGQSADLSEQPVLGHAGPGRSRPAGFGADGADSLLAGRRIRPTRQALGGTAVDGLGPGARQGGALVDRCLVHAQHSDSSLARTTGPHHRAGAPGYGLVSSAANRSRNAEDRKRKYGRRIDAAVLDTLPVQEMELMLYGKVQRVRVRSVHRRGAIPEGAPGAGGVVRDVPVRPHLVAPAPDSGDRDRSVGPGRWWRSTPSAGGSSPCFTI